MEQQSFDLVPFLRRIEELISSDRIDDYHLAVGEMLRHFPEALWQQLTAHLGLPPDSMPEAKRHRKCRCRRCSPRRLIEVVKRPRH